MVASNTMTTWPRTGLGMAALGRPGYITLDRSKVFGEEGRTVEKMQGQADVVMDKLFEVTEKKAATTSSSSSSLDERRRPWLDCARSYGLSEKFVGEYLRSKRVEPESVFVSSKWGYTYVADWKVSLAAGEPHEVKDHSTENFLKQVQETDQYLGEYLDLYQVHSATLESGILTDGRVHRALADCRRDRGWAIGLSVSSPKQGFILGEARKIRVDGFPLFDSVQCTFNLLEQSPGPALREAHEAGMDIIVKEGLANGRILGHPVVSKYARELSCEEDQLALGCVLAQPFRPRVLSGAVEPAHITSNWKALEIADRLEKDPSLLREIMDACVVDSEDYWAERSALAWN